MSETNTTNGDIDVVIDVLFAKILQETSLFLTILEFYQNGQPHLGKVYEDEDSYITAKTCIYYKHKALRSCNRCVYWGIPDSGWIEKYQDRL